MTTTTWIGLLIAALAVGTLVGWLAATNRAGAARRSADLELARGHAELEGLRREAAGLREQLARESDDAARRLAEARAEAERRLAQEREAAKARLDEVKADQEAERQRFRSVAGEALQANSQQFLELANQTLRASTVKNEEALVQREQAIKALVEPLSKSLEQVRAEVAQAEKSRIEGQSTLTEHLRQLSVANSELTKGTGDLVTALRSSQTRGAWGELQLRRVVEAAGMLRNVDFEEQASVATDGGTLRPDMVVHLAGGKHVVVDAKVAFLGYLEAQQTDDPNRREARLDAHVRHVRKHIDDLAGKEYWEQFSPAPEFVVMFVPAEAFLSAAVERDPSLMEYAARQNVILATPMTMLALLKTIAYAWRQEALAENAQKVLTVGKELYSRLVTMTGHITRTGNAIASATTHYNKMIGSLESQVLTSARRMVALDVVDGSKAIDELTGIDASPRAITKPELLAAEEERVVAIESLAGSDQKALQKLSAPDDEAAAG
ncbi:DNA recombination protein RmuC [Xylanimonas allomyrinae]|uniref:DNA recombination protein RmuC n=1 Tax=Xylanimonas allomyrinae TaxID=2509459 RepID=A0A4P6ENW1_9MICO|nr:DNA recombination protein RmuC [Xylanimonas allomyrinae]QAY62007.1 DNA recombination protein RmuC [Xylanimonas allomyrinae]